jgi:hypothetical protein
MLRVRIEVTAAFAGQEDRVVSNIAYAGDGVGIEDDVVRLRRHKHEFDIDTARRPDPRPLRIIHPLSAVSAVIASWR